jgi:hypothetical protein
MVDFIQHSSLLQEGSQEHKIVGADGGDQSAESRELRIQLLLGHLVAVIICSVIGSVSTLSEAKRERRMRLRASREGLVAHYLSEIGQRHAPIKYPKAQDLRVI